MACDFNKHFSKFAQTIIGLHFLLLIVYVDNIFLQKAGVYNIVYVNSMPYSVLNQNNCTI